MKGADRKVQTCSVRGSADLNEDALIVNVEERIYGVADGATSLTGYRDEHGHTGGYIAAQLLASHLRELPPERSLEEAVVGANEALRRRMAEAGVDTADKRQLWAAAFVVFRVRGSGVEYVQAGDCMLFAKYADGTFRQVTRDQVAPCDRMTLSKYKEAIAQGIAEPDKVREYILPTIAENRRKANTPDGYAVLNGDRRFGDFIESGRLSRAGLIRLYAVTDGLFHVLEGVNPSDAWTGMLSEIDRLGLEAYATELTRIEQADADRTKYPRLKASDDKTGIVLDLGHADGPDDTEAIRR